MYVVVVTGMSGAGRSTALNAFEDLGFFCVDNLPPPLAREMVALAEVGDELRRVAFGIDVRTGAFIEGLEEVLSNLEAGGHSVEVMFLDCADEALIQRFSETRRTHPMAAYGDVPQAIQQERDRLGPLRARADIVIDTTDLSVHELRRGVIDHVARGGGGGTMNTRILSFGFKYGVPADADLIFDLRYMPNPHFVPELRPKTGRDPAVASFVLDTEEASEFLGHIMPMLTDLLPRYEKEGKSYLTIALGCTGGKHRSVAMAETIAKRLGEARDVWIHHRDAERVKR